MFATLVFVKQHLDPADKVIRAFGGAETLGKLIGKSRSQVHRWRLPRERGGCGGLIPPRHHVKLIELAHQEGVNLDKADLVPWLAAQAAE